MLYNDATRWEYDHISVQRMTIINKEGDGVTSLRSEAFNEMYKLKAS